MSHKFYPIKEIGDLMKWSTQLNTSPTLGQVWSTKYGSMSV